MSKHRRRSPPPVGSLRYLAGRHVAWMAMWAEELRLAAGIRTLAAAAQEIVLLELLPEYCAAADYLPEPARGADGWL